ncbi:MAG TPA: hypothetical protein VKA35_08635 [Solirubrobacterales bacterium]|nr:hypothetical protein [Solirubrobacterales bacterium]
MSRRGKPSDISKQQRALRTDTAERLEAIVEAAERAAQSVIDDAEAQARRYLAQAQADAGRASAGRIGELSELIDSLLGQAISLRREAERLQETLEAARLRIDGEEAPAPAPESAPREPQPRTEEVSEAPRLRAVSPPEVPAVVPGPDARRSDPAGARLLATQLAVSGSSREEIAERLRNGFEIEDADGILNAILGPED